MPDPSFYNPKTDPMLEWMNRLDRNKPVVVLGLVGLVTVIAGAIVLVRSLTPSADVEFSIQEPGVLATTSGILRVDIAGAVQYPGVYDLPSGSRIQDVLVKAGGLSSSADRDWVEKSINRAAKVSDGTKIYIPRKGETASSGYQNVSGNSDSSGQTVSSNLISINSGTLSQLDSLPGVGPVTAQKIIDNRPYLTLEEIRTKKAVSASVFEKIKDRITLY